MIKSYIRIRTEVEGFHQWNNAPDEVDFLRNLHRHLFKITVTMSVSHSDRDVEFFILKRELKDWLFMNPILSGSSCEQYAEEILKYCILSKYPTATYVEVVVSEDGENDGIVEYAKEV